MCSCLQPTHPWACIHAAPPPPTHADNPGLVSEPVPTHGGQHFQHASQQAAAPPAASAAPPAASAAPAAPAHAIRVGSPHGPRAAAAGGVRNPTNAINRPGFIGTVGRLPFTVVRRSFGLLASAITMGVHVSLFFGDRLLPAPMMRSLRGVHLIHDALNQSPPHPDPHPPP